MLLQQPGTMTFWDKIGEILTQWIFQTISVEALINHLSISRQLACLLSTQALTISIKFTVTKPRIFEFNGQILPPKSQSTSLETGGK